jgi:hypothetical protein
MIKVITNRAYRGIRKGLLPAVAMALLGTGSANAQCVIASGNTVNADDINPATCGGVITVNGTLVINSVAVDWYSNPTLAITVSGPGSLMAFPGSDNRLFLPPGSTVTLSSGGELDTSTPCGTTDRIYIGVDPAVLTPTTMAYASCAPSIYSDFTFAELNAISGSVYEWTGEVNTDWSNSGNWAANLIPNASRKARVPAAPANQPTVNTLFAQAQSLEVRSGAQVTIASGRALTIQGGVLRNDGVINIQNNASLSQDVGSIVDGSGTFNVTRIGSSTYDFWSSPVENAPVSALGGTVYQYNPGAGVHVAGGNTNDAGWGSPSGSNLTVGRGYAAYGAGTRTFTGRVNNGPIDVPVQYFDYTQGGMPFNLVGNPYPSGIDAETFLLENNTGVLDDGTIYLWDEPSSGTFSSSDYATVNLLGASSGGGGNTPEPVIGSHQGFKVKASATAGNVRFRNSQRVTFNSNVFFREAEVQRIWLSALSSGNHFNQTLVGFHPEATDGKDWGYDGPKLNATSAWSFYSVLDGEPYAIQAFGEMYDSRIVPLGLHTEESTMATIALDSTQGSLFGAVILEDRFYGIFHDLRNGAYTFRAAQGEHAGRLFLHVGYSDLTSIDDLAEGTNFHGYISDDRLYVRSNSPMNGMLELVDMSGRTVFSTSLSAQDAQVKEGFDVSSLSSGVYAIRVQDASGNRSLKVVKQ